MDRPLSEESISSRRKLLSVRLVISLAIVSLLVIAIQWVFSPTVKRDKIRTATVSKGTITATINAGGLVVPQLEETLSSEIDSQIIRVLAQVGTAVKQGDPILQLDTQGVHLEIASLKEKIALKDTQIETKRLVLKKSVNDIDSQHALLQVDLESRATRAERLNQLSSIGAFSKHDLLEAKLNVKRTKIELQQLKQAKLDLKSTTDAEIDGLELEKSLLAKELAEQERLLKFSTLRATRDGILSWLKNEEGASVSIREPLAKIADTSRFKIEATLSDFYASQLVSGMPAEITYNDQVIPGRLTTQTPTIENGVMKLLIELDNPQNDFLRHNLRVDVGLISQTVKDTHTLAKGPYISGRGIQHVFVIRDNTAYRTEIQVGLSNANNYQVIEGLNEGDEVIISNVSDYLHLNQIAVN